MSRDLVIEASDEMRKSGKWNSVWDDRILEYMYQRGGKVAPRHLDNDDRFRVSKGQLVRRLQTMQEHGLTHSDGSGEYEITERGIRYLRGEADISKRQS